MSSLELPEKTQSLNTEQLRQLLAGLIDPQDEKTEWYSQYAKPVAVEFCAALPQVFSESLDRMTMWDKIAAAIQSAYAKTVSGDIDLFVQHVLESIKADASKAISNEKMVHAIESLQMLPEHERQDWLSYLVTHLIPVLVAARKAHKDSIGGAN